MKKIGLTWLQERYRIEGYQLTHESYIGSIDKIELSSRNTIIQTFKSKYDVGADNPLLHLEFALKYDDLNLAFIKEIFDYISNETLSDFINEKPNRKYVRIIGYLYEFITGKIIDVKLTTTNYIDLIDANKYIVGDIEKITKWKINDNLLGTNNFCPIIRKTTELNEVLKLNVAKEIEDLEKKYSRDIFKRASYYLYKKETKSSNEIEQEKPSLDRVEKFISLLEEAGQKSLEEALSESELVRLQNAIVDRRYANRSFRNFQNYVGQTLRDASQKIHYICPPPQYVRELIYGLTSLGQKNTATSAVIKATMVSFGFVYIHPFEDGNGRIHRFLIHDILVRDGIVPNSTILPVSAQILTHMVEYDTTLEVLSKLVGRKAKYDLDEDSEMTVLNPSEIKALYQYPDLTNHAVFLSKAIQTTISKDIPEELLFLQRYDELKKDIISIVDMPDKKVDKMILFLHQNKGRLASRKRKLYTELKNSEIEKMEEAYRDVFTEG